MSTGLNALQPVFWLLYSFIRPNYFFNHILDFTFSYCGILLQHHLTEVSFFKRLDF
jgi:hypothetical protein